MITRRELQAMFQSLPSRGQAVIAHGSYKALGAVDGGPATVIEALAQSAGALVMPAFTYDTMVTPLVGPPNNAMDYSEEARQLDSNSGQTPFRPNLPADKDMGVLAETLRRRADAKRSLHPILSFAGVNADFALDRQTIFDPFAPIGALAEKNGWVLLIGVDHKVNTSIHYAEKLAGRKQFVRWALTSKRVVECPNFPGDSYGFDAIRDYLHNDADVIHLGGARVEAIPLNRLIDKVKMLIKQDPLALLCQRSDCARCKAVRDSI
ncbi:MAG: AAC(3) family N-acetyltransferase [Chloroflexota bacterium]